MALNIGTQIEALLTKLETRPDAAEIVTTGKAFVAAMEKNLPAMAVAIVEAELYASVPWLATVQTIIDPALKGIAAIGEQEAEKLLNAWLLHKTANL